MQRLRRVAPLWWFGPGVLALSLGCGDKESSPAPAPSTVAGTAGSGGAGGAGGSAVSTKPLRAVVDLRADVNRDGVAKLDDPADDADEDTWDRTHGAIFLANIDDDEDRCSALDDDGGFLSDLDLPDCNDAADTIVNGADDEADLAPLRVAPWADAPEDASATITVPAAQENRVRIFARRNGAFEVVDATTRFTAQELRAGLELGLEGRDILRDESRWDGVADVKLTVTGGTRDGVAVEGGTDVVRLRLAPVLTHHHLEKPVRAFVTNAGDQSSKAFRADLEAAVTSAGVPEGLEAFSTDDIWAQDFFETAYTSMPGKDGPHVMRIALRSANLYSDSKTSPLRRAGRVAFTRFRGRDSAGVQQFDLKSNPDMDSLNSMGNFETIPPFAVGDEKWPVGRILRGSIPKFHPDASFSRMLEAQRVQKPVLVDTSWLLVGHVDETLSFVKSATPRGWKLLVNDPSLARKMLEDAAEAGHGDVVMFDGLRWPTNKGTRPAAVTISEVLDDSDVMGESAEAAVHIDDQLAVLREATQLADDEIIRVPFLHQSVDGFSVAYQPGMVNGVYLSPTHFAAPKPFGPIIDGEDIFEKAFRDSLAGEGIEVTFIDDWDLYHVNDGEVHCGTNTSRETTGASTWWEAL